MTDEMICKYLRERIQQFADGAITRQELINTCTNFLVGVEAENVFSRERVQQYLQSQKP